jgi:hypothetical protein
MQSHRRSVSPRGRPEGVLVATAQPIILSGRDPPSHRKQRMGGHSAYPFRTRRGFDLVIVWVGWAGLDSLLREFLDGKEQSQSHDSCRVLPSYSAKLFVLGNR